MLNQQATYLAEMSLVQSLLSKHADTDTYNH